MMTRRRSGTWVSSELLKTMKPWRAAWNSDDSDGAFSIINPEVDSASLCNSYVGHVHTECVEFWVLTLKVSSVCLAAAYPNNQALAFMLWLWARCNQNSWWQLSRAMLSTTSITWQWAAALLLNTVRERVLVFRANHNLPQHPGASSGSWLAVHGSSVIP